MSYTIQQVSKMTRIPATTLRYYDKEGLLPFLERTESGYRRFSDVDLASLQIVQCLKSARLSIEEIRQFSEWVHEGDSTLQRNGRKSSTSSITNASITRKLSKQERKSISSPRTNCPTQMNSSQPCLLYQILRHLKIESIKKSPFGIQISWTQREISIFTIHVFRRFLLSGRTSLVFLRGSVRRSTVLLRGFRG